MIQLDTLTTILITAGPVISGIATMVTCFFKYFKHTKNYEKVVNEKVAQQAENLAVIRSKLASIENHMLDKGGKKHV